MLKLYAHGKYSTGPDPCISEDVEEYIKAPMEIEEFNLPEDLEKAKAFIRERVLEVASISTGNPIGFYSEPKLAEIWHGTGMHFDDVGTGWQSEDQDFSDDFWFKAEDPGEVEKAINHFIGLCLTLGLF